MLKLVHNETHPTFFEQFFFENPVQNDVFIIEVNKKTFLFRIRCCDCYDQKIKLKTTRIC